MEKADILELAVDYLKTVKTVTSPTSKDTMAKYQSGYKQCAQEVGQYLGGLPGIRPELASRVRSHLERKDTRQQQQQQQQEADHSRVTPPEATPYGALPGATKDSRAISASVSAPVPVYANGHIAAQTQRRFCLPQVNPCSVQTISIQNGHLMLDSRSPHSVPRTVSPLTASEAYQKCGLEVSTRLPGFCQDAYLVKTHADTPIWRPW